MSSHVIGVSGPFDMDVAYDMVERGEQIFPNDMIAVGCFGGRDGTDMKMTEIFKVLAK